MRLILGVTGGIATYKACEIISQTLKMGGEVRVVMTENATRFVTQLTFEALTGHPVMTSAMDTTVPKDGLTQIEHIEWAKWATVAAVAPLTANSLGKLACGLADDALSTVIMALPAEIPVVLAPAMNTQMWLNPVVQRNLRWLEELGRYRMVPPVHKRLACGDVGMGGLASPSDIMAEIVAATR